MMVKALHSKPEIFFLTVSVYVLVMMEQLVRIRINIVLYNVRAASDVS